MREIKFRLWDKRDKLWVTGWSIDQSGETSDIGNRVFMQYTGLKDKNGVGIYEGDIVKGTWVNLLVEWAESDAGFNFSGETDWRPFTENQCKNVKVIGNIYQNPELLKN